MENYNNDWETYDIRKCASLFRWKEEDQNLYFHEPQRTVRDKVGTFCPAYGAHPPSSQAGGLVTYIFLITFIYLKETPLLRLLDASPGFMTMRWAPVCRSPALYPSGILEISCNANWLFLLKRGNGKEEK